MIRNVRIVAHNCPVRLKNKAGFFEWPVFLYNVCAMMVRSDENREQTHALFSQFFCDLLCVLFS